MTDTSTASTHSTPTQADSGSPARLLEVLLQQQAEPKAMGWLLAQSKKIESQESLQPFFIAYSAASRYFENRPLALTAEEKAAAETLRPGFQPEYWSLLQTARSLLLLALPQQDAEAFSGALDRLAETADVAEQTALYAALPLLPFSEALRKRAAEGIRTNMTVVFDAIALHNPYPADYLDEGAWNQMVLKAVFMDRPLYQIWGAGRRANPELAQMLLHFAHERWAAGRSVTPELWRFVGPFLKQDSFTDMERVSREGTPVEREAVLLACAASTLPQAQQLLLQYPEQAQQIKQGVLNWSSLGQRCQGS